MFPAVRFGDSVTVLHHRLGDENEMTCRLLQRVFALRHPTKHIRPCEIGTKTARQIRASREKCCDKKTFLLETKLELRGRCCATLLRVSRLFGENAAECFPDCGCEEAAVSTERADVGQLASVGPAANGAVRDAEEHCDLTSRE